MELLFEFITELVPDAVLAFIGEKCFGRIKARVPNRILRGLLYILLVLGFAVVGVGLAFAVIILINALIS